MKRNTVKIITAITLLLSSLLSATMATFAVLTVVILKAIPPVIVSLLINAFWVWTVIHYWKCYVRFKTEMDVKAQPNTKLKKQTIVLIAIMSVIAGTMWFILFGLIVLYRVFFAFQIYFLIVAVVATVYVIHSTVILKALQGKCTVD